jgi:hypothetical protein
MYVGHVVVEIHDGQFEFDSSRRAEVTVEAVSEEDGSGDARASRRSAHLASCPVTAADRDLCFARFTFQWSGEKPQRRGGDGESTVRDGS